MINTRILSLPQNQVKLVKMFENYDLLLDDDMEMFVSFI